MLRPTRDETLVATAEIWALRSTCSRLQVGCIIHRDGRILVTGYNGAPTGMSHCDHHCSCGRMSYDDEGREVHDFGCNAAEPCTTAVHAEQNAVAFAARHGVGLNEADLVVTHQPCLSCAMSVVNAGIRSVIYVHPYRLQEGVNLLKDAGVWVRQYS